MVTIVPVVVRKKFETTAARPLTQNSTELRQAFEPIKTLNLSRNAIRRGIFGWRIIGRAECISCLP